ncbi:hypothetical protein [Flavobacterium micromati]|jgi:hypothetical protein|nr:hypothetical protein [Flavobacterium micromati]
MSKKGQKKGFPLQSGLGSYDTEEIYFIIQYPSYSPAAAGVRGI